MLFFFNIDEFSQILSISSIILKTDFKWTLNYFRFSKKLPFLSYSKFRSFTHSQFALQLTQKRKSSVIWTLTSWALVYFCSSSHIHNDWAISSILINYLQSTVPCILYIKWFFGYLLGVNTCRSDKSENQFKLFINFNQLSIFHLSSSIIFKFPLYHLFHP